MTNEYTDVKRWVKNQCVFCGDNQNVRYCEGCQMRVGWITRWLEHIKDPSTSAPVGSLCTCVVMTQGILDVKPNCPVHGGSAPVGSPPPQEQDVQLQCFLQSIIDHHGCNSHEWLVACAKALASAPRGGGETRPLQEHEEKDDHTRGGTSEISGDLQSSAAKGKGL
jgi:hypothetical protein